MIGTIVWLILTMNGLIKRLYICNFNHLVKHGANRLSEIKPEDYAVLMEEAENL